MSDSKPAGLFHGLWLPLLVAAVLFLGGLLRFHDLNRQSLWQDEIHTVLYVNDFPPLTEVISRVAVQDLHSPLYYLLLRAHVAILSHLHLPPDAGHLRWLSALLGCLSLLSLYAFFAAAFPEHPWLAWLGLAAGAASMYGIYYSQEVRMYSLILFLAPLVLWSQLKLWTASGEKLHAGYASGMVLGSVLLLYSSLICLFFVAGVWAATLLVAGLEHRRHRRRWLEVLVLGAVVLLAYLPWAGVMVRQSLDLRGGVETGLVILNPRELLKFALENLLFHSWKIGWGYGLWNKLIRLLSPLVLLNLLDPAQRRRHGLLLLGFVFAFLADYAATFHRPFHTGRYFAAWWPYALYLILGAFSGLQVLLKRFRPAWQGVVPVLLALFFAGYFWVQAKQVEYYFTGFHKENWRGAAAVLSLAGKQGDAILAQDRWHAACLAYYGLDWPVVLPRDLEKAGVPERYPRLFYVDNQRPETTFPKWASAFSPLNRASGSNLRIYVLETKKLSGAL